MEKPKPRIHIIVGNKTPEEMLQGLLLDKDQVTRATLAITDSIEKSFEYDEKKHGHRVERTRAAVEYRFRIALKVAMRLLGDYNMPVASLKVRLPRALRAELNGKDYAPSDKRVLRGI